MAPPPGKFKSKSKKEEKVKNTVHSPANTLNTFAMHINKPIKELTYNVRKEDGLYSCFKISVGDGNDALWAIGENPGVDMKRRHLRMIACGNFVEKYAEEIEVTKRKEKEGIDYMDYSSHTVLSSVKKVYFNDTSVFDILKPTHVALDTEGIPPILAQVCFDENTVALFELPRFTGFIKFLMEDPNIMKIVCDVRSEERNFAKYAPIKLQNYIDIGSGPNGAQYSLVRLIKDNFDIQLKKDKGLHIRGWRAPLPQKHIDYAIADAVWTYKIWKTQNKKTDDISNVDTTP